jgi:hypothetical protein
MNDAAEFEGLDICMMTCMLVAILVWLVLWCLMPLSTILQLKYYWLYVGFLILHEQYNIEI